MKKTPFKCPYCNKTLANNDRTISAHMLYDHGGLTKQSRTNVTKKYTIECQECQQLTANTQNGLALHLKSTHDLDYISYIIKHQYDGQHPMCKCGCNQKLQWKKGKNFGEYIHGHNKRKKNKKSPEPKNTPLPELSIPETAEAQSVTPPGNIPDKEQKLPQPKLINTHGFVPQWKWNPLMDDDEFVNNRTEIRFLDEQIRLKNVVTKRHEISIPYIIDDKQYAYKPDFVSFNKATIYDTANHQALSGQKMLDIINQWCTLNGFTFKVIKYED